MLLSWMSEIILGALKWRHLSLSVKIIPDVKLAYGLVHHRYIKNTSKGIDFEVLVEMADSNT